MSIPRTKTPKLYYEYDEKSINFTLFDEDMRMLMFSSGIVEDYKF